MAMITAMGLNILVVDDEKSVTTTVSYVLQRSGHTVDVAHDGEDALLRLTESLGHYQILITDHCMHKVSGLALVERLRETEFQGRILVISGCLSQRMKESYLALGVERILSKPFGAQELREAVGELAQGFAC